MAAPPAVAGAVAARSRPAAEAEAILAEPTSPKGAATIGAAMSDGPRTYTLDEANALIPEVRAVLLQLAVEQRRLDAAHAEMHRQLEGNGGPESVAAAGRQEAEVSDIREGMRTLLQHLSDMGVELRDLEMGLVDFPGERDGERVWLCWKLADPRVAFWHRTDEGYASRRPW